MALKRLVKRAVPVEWERQLAELSPRTERYTWLKLIWEEGHPWEPVERFFIYQMVPARGINADILAELKGPPPSKRGNYYDRVLGRFVRNPDVNITERAWNLYQQFGCWGRPFWVIQGEKGGHKRWFSSIEKKFLKLAGLPADPPVPGDLPYADFDERVMEQLRRHDRLQAVHGNLKRFKAENTELWEQRKDEAEKEFRRQLVTWLKEQVAEIAPDVTKSLFGLDAPRRRINASRFEEMTERAEENFIETGRTGTPRLITV